MLLEAFYQQSIVKYVTPILYAWMITINYDITSVLWWSKDLDDGLDDFQCRKNVF